MNIKIVNTQSAKDESLVLLSGADSFSSLINTMMTIKNSINSNWSDCNSKNFAVNRLQQSIEYYRDKIVPALEKLGTSVAAYSVATEQLASLNRSDSEQFVVKPLSYSSTSDVIDTPSMYADMVGFASKVNNPDFTNDEAWKTKNPYAYAGYYGQCTWFAWGRFYEMYGYDPGFRKDGKYCVDQLLETHPDNFYASDVPVSGSVFSITPKNGGSGHVGIITSIDGNMITVQDGNMDGATNSFAGATTDWRTRTITIDEFNQYVAQKGTVQYANPYNFVNPQSALDKFNSATSGEEMIIPEDLSGFV